MLAVAPFPNLKNETENQMENSPMDGYDQFPDLSSAGNDLIDAIDFDDLFAGIDEDADILPDFDMDPEILAQFSLAAGHDDFDPPGISSPKSDTSTKNNENESESEKEAPAPSSSDLGPALSSSSRTEAEPTGRNNSSPKDKGRKSTATSKNPPGKKKVKVDWTPELHRRFVQAVEQLGLDKAVPSRILEVMGIDCLTRHHIASHLQKYRSHRKHLLAREAEAASWGRRRQAYGGGAGGDAGSWIAPTMGFPPVAVAPPPMPHFRPLHVWGHPSVDQSLMHTWQRHPPHTWPPTPPPPPSDPSFWIPHHHHVPSPGTPCFPPHLTAAAPPAAVPPPVVVGQGQEPPRPPADVHPSKECVDAAIGDALSKPWLPLPLGLKPPSVDGVMHELQRQGVSKVPPAC